MSMGRAIFWRPVCDCGRHFFLEREALHMAHAWLQHRWHLEFSPLPLQAFHIFSILLILYYVTGYVLIRQKKIKLGKDPVFLAHSDHYVDRAYHNHNLAVRMMGGTSEGAKPAILMYLIVLAYFCGINVSTPPFAFLVKCPYWPSF